MQVIFFPKETEEKENRSALVPPTAEKFCALGFDVLAEKSIGAKIEIADSEYEAAGAKIVANYAAGATQADVIARVKCSSCQEISTIKPGAIHLSFLDLNRQSAEVQAFQKAGIRAISLEMIPRTSIAQKFDALSSQANLAGYAAVLIASTSFGKIFPMMTTSAGTIHPINVFIIGVGVAGLQAIATAKRLGARVEAFDTRAETEEQVKSLGVKFLKIDIGETEKTEQGYARELSAEQIQKQQQGMIAACQRADIVITTAKVFGKKAPILITKNMLDDISSKTLFIDLAVAFGGNVEGSARDQLIRYSEWVNILGISEAEQSVACTASQVFAENIYNFIDHFCDKKTQEIILSPEDSVISKCLVNR
ncbi:MAG: NAD(P) transhydrogenase subunit alpha [Puniceicoccales bacterium]|nr:NAD(P) transhydrogenase subunit alpha [Puniceicoccales bacterium]